MPNIKSAAKRMRTSRINRERNRQTKGELLTFRKKLDAAIAAGDKAKGKQAFDALASALDKAAKKGIIKANNASRKKSRAAAALAKIA